MPRQSAIAAIGPPPGERAADDVFTTALHLRALLEGNRVVRYVPAPDLPAGGLDGCSLAYLSGSTLAGLRRAGRDRLLRQIAGFRARGGLTAFDPRSDPARWPDTHSLRQGILAGYRACDIALNDFAAEARLFGDTTPEGCAFRIAALGAFEVVVRNAAGPVLLHSGGRQTRLPLPGPLPQTGERFNAGWLAARLGGASATGAVLAGYRFAAGLGDRPLADISGAFEAR